MIAGLLSSALEQDLFCEELRCEFRGDAYCECLPPRPAGEAP